MNGGGTATATTFSDSVNGSTGWSTAKDVANSPLLLSKGWRYFASGQTVTVTATYNATCTQRGIKLTEITGAVTPGALDGTPAGQFQLNVGTGADAITSGNFTTSGQPALIHATCMNYGNNKNPAAGTGFTSTRVDWNTDVGGCRVEYKRVTSTGTQAGTFTGPSTDSWITIAIAFDEAAAGSSPPPPPTEPYPRRPPQRYPRTTDFTIPPAASVFTGTGFPSPERAARAFRWLPPPRIEALPPMMAALPPPPPPEAPRALPFRRLVPAANGDALPPMAATAPPPPPPEALRALPRRGATAISYQPTAAPPLPPAVLGPAPPAPLVVRAFRRIVRWIATEAGWPAMPAVVVATPTLPLTILWDVVDLRCFSDSSVLTVSPDDPRLRVLSD